MADLKGVRPMNASFLRTPSDCSGVRRMVGPVSILYVGSPHPGKGIRGRGESDHQMCQHVGYEHQTCAY